MRSGKSGFVFIRCEKSSSIDLPNEYLQKDHLFTRNVGKELRCVMEGAIVDLLRVPENALQVRAGGIIQADQMPDEMGI
jgi:hypothetical protein